jgi:hypothetical protein
MIPEIAIIYLLVTDAILLALSVPTRDCLNWPRQSLYFLHNRTTTGAKNRYNLSDTARG